MQSITSSWEIIAEKFERISANVKVGGVKRAAGLWIRADGNGGSAGRGLSFEDKDHRPIAGTTDWKRYEVALDVPLDSRDIAFGIRLQGQGKVEVEGFELQDAGSAKVARSVFHRLPTSPVNLDFAADTRGVFKSTQSVTMALEDVDVRQIIQVMANRGGVDLVMEDTVQGKLTVNFNKVSLDEAFRIVADKANLIWEVKDGNLLVMSRIVVKPKAR